MNFGLRMTFSLVILYGLTPVHAGFGALDRDASDPSAGNHSSLQVTSQTVGQVKAIAFDADGHLDVPRDSNGHLRIKTTFGRHGSLNTHTTQGSETCGVEQTKPQPQGRETVTKAAAKEILTPTR